MPRAHSSQCLRQDQNLARAACFKAEALYFPGSRVCVGEAASLCPEQDQAKEPGMSVAFKMILALEPAPWALAYIKH